MSTPSLPSAEINAIPSIKPYWEFAQNPFNQGSNIVKAHGNKLGIAEPHTQEEGHVTFIDKEGRVLISDDHASVVKHFKNAFKNAYQKKFNKGFVTAVFASKELAEALRQGLSYHHVVQVYDAVEKIAKDHARDSEKVLGKLETFSEALKEADRISKRSMEPLDTETKFLQLSKEIATCAKKAEEASKSVIGGTLLQAKQWALKAREQHQLAKKLLTQLKESPIMKSSNERVQRAVQQAKRDVQEVALSAKEAAEVVDRNHRLLGGPRLDIDVSSQEPRILPKKSASQS